uniref:Skp1_POZ domain-containing protein n=1 Tax=Panagrellus redivivus TaxID=6233 RepID=A0A7E4V0S7_PANRE
MSSTNETPGSVTVRTADGILLELPQGIIADSITIRKALESHNGTTLELNLQQQTLDDLRAFMNLITYKKPTTAYELWKIRNSDCEKLIFKFLDDLDDAKMAALTKAIGTLKIGRGVGPIVRYFGGKSESMVATRRRFGLTDAEFNELMQV